jgi:hypothetical protein
MHAVLLLVLLAGCAGAPSTPSPSSPDSARSGCVGEWPLAGKTVSSGPIPLLANSDLAAGENRLLLGLVDAEGFPLGSPAWSLKVQTFDITNDGCAPLTPPTDLPFVWSINEVRGFFIGDTSFPTGAEEIGLSISGEDADGTPLSIRFTTRVAPVGTALRPGAVAPTIATPTQKTSEHGLAGISTDPEPLPRLYKYSAADLIAAGTPFVIVFASPAFCVSQACGPTISVVKKAAARHPGAIILHVEPYLMEWNGSRVIPTLDASGRLQPSAVATAWRLPVEPWIYTVDGNGVIIHSFEGVIGDAELDAAIKEIDAD